MTAQMQNKRLLDCFDKEAYGLFMSRCMCLRSLFQRRTLQWTVDAHRFTSSVMLLQRHMADHQKCIHSNVSCEGFLVNILKWTLAHASGRAERMSEFLVFKEKKKLPQCLNCLHLFFNCCAQLSLYQPFGNALLLLSRRRSISKTGWDKVRLKMQKQNANSYFQTSLLELELRLVPKIHVFFSTDMKTTLISPFICSHILSLSSSASMISASAALLLCFQNSTRSFPLS